MKPTLLIAGCLALAAGLLFIGQGTGIFPYPKSSFMISQPPWTHRGAALAIAGLIAIAISRKIKK